MKKFDNIVMSQTEPSTTSLWLKDGQLFYYDGGWKPCGGESLPQVNPDIPPVILGSRKPVKDGDTLPK